MTQSTYALVLVPVLAAILGAIAAAYARPTPAVVSGVQHLAAGVVFAAAAEVLPDVMRFEAPIATLVGGVVGIGVMLGIMQAERRWEGPIGMAATTAVDLLVDDLILGLGFVAGAKAGVLLTIALTFEVLFLGLTVADAFGGTRARVRSVVATGLLTMALPLGAMLASPISHLPGPVVAGFLAFGLVALLYLVTEELLVEAHGQPDRPWVTALFFVGFLAVLLLDQAIG